MRARAGARLQARKCRALLSERGPSDAGSRGIRRTMLPFLLCSPIPVFTITNNVAHGLTFGSRAQAAAVDSRPGGWLWVTDHRLDAELGHENGFFPSRRAVWEICCPSRCTRVLNPARELAPTSGGSPHSVGQPAATGGCTVRVGRRGRAVADAAGMQGCRSLAEGSNGIVPSRISWCSSPQIVRCT